MSVRDLDFLCPSFQIKIPLAFHTQSSHIAFDLSSLFPATNQLMKTWFSFHQLTFGWLLGCISSFNLSSGDTICQQIISICRVINDLCSFCLADKTIKLWKISERDKRPEGYNLKEEDGRYRDFNTVTTLRVCIILINFNHYPNNVELVYYLLCCY